MIKYHRFYHIICRPDSGDVAAVYIFLPLFATSITNKHNLQLYIKITPTPIFHSYHHYP